MAILAGKKASNTNEIEEIFSLFNSEATATRFNTYPGVANNRRLTGIADTRQKATWLNGIACVRLRAFGTAGNRLRVVFDVGNDSLADSWLVETSGEGVTVMYNEIVVGDDWVQFEFPAPGILNLHVIGQAAASDELLIEAYELGG